MTTAAAASGAVVVVGSHGYGAIGGALMGSVSRRLVTSSTVPLTIVRSSSATATPRKAVG